MLTNSRHGTSFMNSDQKLKKIQQIIDSYDPHTDSFQIVLEIQNCINGGKIEV